MAWAGTPGPPKKEAFYRDYEYTEEEVLLWHGKPDCYHEDKRGIPSALLQVMVAARWGGPLWIYHPAQTVIYVSCISEQREPETYSSPPPLFLGLL